MCADGRSFKVHAECDDDKIELSPVKKDLKLTFKNVISESIIRENALMACIQSIAKHTHTHARCHVRHVIRGRA